MQQKTKGIVISSKRISDSKRIVEIYTSAAGRASFLIRVSPNARSYATNALYQPLSILEFVTHFTPGANLLYLKDPQFLYSFTSIPFNPYKMTIALFLSEFLHRALRAECEDRPLFEFLSASIQWLDAAKTNIANFHLAFLMQISRYLGLYPNMDGYREGSYFDLVNGRFCEQKPMYNVYLKEEESRWISVLMRMRYSNMHLFKMTREQRMACLTVMNDYYRLHIPNFPKLKSLEVLKDLFD